MRCEQVQELLSPYMDKVTLEEENRVIEAHLDNCFTCSNELSRMQEVSAHLHNLESQQAPEGFAEDVHKRIAQEKIKAFRSQELFAPKKSGWIAASAAGVALFIGIYLSNFLPVGSMVAAIQSWANKDNQKPQISVEDIINRTKLQNGLKNQAPFQKQANTQVAVVDPASSKNDASKPAGNKTTHQTSPALQSKTGSTQFAAVTQLPKMAESYSTKIRVNDIESSVQKVYQIADADGAEVVLPASAGTVVQVGSESQVKVLSLQVAETKAEKVLNSLEAMGASSPALNTITYTSDYVAAEAQLAAVGQQIQTLEGSGSLTADQNAQLAELKKQQTNLQNQKKQMDQAVNQVTIEVRLIEQAK